MDLIVWQWNRAYIFPQALLFFVIVRLKLYTNLVTVQSDYGVPPCYSRFFA